MKLPTSPSPRRTADSAAEPPKPLAQQQNEFTEEGSPPPGRVGNAPPRTTPKSKLARRKP
jgi:hypothetical protein